MDRRRFPDAFLNSLDAFTRTPAERQIHSLATTRTLMDMPVPVILGEQDTPFLELWIRFGHTDDRGRRLLDRYMAQVAPAAASPEGMAAASWRRTWYSLFAIREQKDGHRVIEDLLLGGRHRMVEDHRSGDLTPAFCMLSWIRPSGDVVHRVGSPVAVQAKQGPWLAERIREMMAMLRPQRPGREDRDLLREMAWSIHVFLRAVASGVTTPNQMGFPSGTGSPAAP